MPRAGLAALGLVMTLDVAGCTREKPATTEVRAPAMISVYVGNDPPELQKFERWLGRRVDGHQVHTGSRDWADWTDSIDWEIKLWKDVHRPIFWSIPLIPRGATLENAARGEYNHAYVVAATALNRAYANQERIYIRTGWEFNADWFPWSAIGKETAYVLAFRSFVTSFRSVSNKFVFEWTANEGDHGMNPEHAYPGDPYVDLIGMDFYYNLAYDSSDPLAAWNGKVWSKYGLAWLESFARLHGKPTAYSEWGVMSDSAGLFVREAGAWFATHHVVYQSYWNSDAAFEGKLSGNRIKTVGDVYRSTFASQAGP
jgi:hypothetical protein